MAEVKDNSAEFNDDIRQKLIKKLTAVGITLVNAIKENISIPSFPERSKPGEYPHKEDDGILRSSITYNVDKENLNVKVGTPLLYGKFLERGTRKMAARPFLQLTTIQQAEKIKAIMGGK
jgi:HK97 gp10 family phage protein